MHLTYHNVNTAFRGIVTGIHEKRIPVLSTTSRNGPVFQVIGPMIITYLNPTQCVLFNAERDCNPFFHLYEALWMLAGRNDVASLAYYNKRMATFSDDGKTLNGAYGYRWRNSEDLDFRVFDQLQILIKHLRNTPDSRRAVLSMWNVKDDLIKIGGVQTDPHSTVATNTEGGLQVPGSKDVCCNLCVTFGIRTVQTKEPTEGPVSYLDMTVFNRSNDLVWGTMGTNAVHFAFLLEYMADMLGVKVGAYHQVSSNQHAYLNNWKPAEWLSVPPDEPEAYPQPHHVLVTDRETFDEEVQLFAHKFGGSTIAQTAREELPNFKQCFLQSVAMPMCVAWFYHKAKDYEKAMEAVNKCAAADWRMAGLKWLQRRAQTLAISRGAAADERLLKVLKELHR